jgi:poly(glycerol-phosphate) alpha-glucosyltransferase
VQGLVEGGMNVHVFGVRDRFSEADISQWHPVNVSIFNPTGPEKFGYSPGFLKELRAYQPHITHTHGIWFYPSIATHAYYRQTRSPYVISTHGMLDPWAIANSRWKKLIARFFYEGAHLRDARCLRALCESEANFMRRARLKNDIAIIPNGIDLPTGPPSGRPPWHSLVEPGKKVLLFLSRIHPKKGLPALIRAWASIQNGLGEPDRGSAREWVLAIAGWDQGGHEAELKKLASELGSCWIDARTATTENRASGAAATGSSIIFLGPQFHDAKAACYYHCDSFVLPSLSEGVPMVVLEAWGHRKPVLMTRFCNLPHGFRNAAAIEIGTSPETLAEGVRTLLLMTSKERADMGSRGYALAGERFTWARVTSQLRELYAWILGGGPKPACIADF